jgi:hypothetical protein
MQPHSVPHLLPHLLEAVWLRKHQFSPDFQLQPSLNLVVTTAVLSEFNQLHMEFNQLHMVQPTD